MGSRKFDEGMLHLLRLANDPAQREAFNAAKPLPSALIQALHDRHANSLAREKDVPAWRHEAFSALDEAIRILKFEEAGNTRSAGGSRG